MTAPGALVIGGTGGLGSAICRRLAADGYRVAIGYRSRAAAAATLAAELGGGASIVRCDLADAASVAAAFADTCALLERIDAIAFAGGVAIEQPFVAEIGEDAWSEVIETELIGFARVIGAAIPIFRMQGGGALVAVTSVATVSYPPGDALSAVPKAAIEMLGRAVAKEEGRNGIRVNMVAPGIMADGLGAEFIERLYTPEIWETQRRRTALRRFGRATEVADAVAFLASERSGYITGQTLVVDGGFSL
jgi:NAD(P)-dependent dehydrogenase (short-subunit alcohol dehydrogenase family)